jgi:hypothetical protein
MPRVFFSYCHADEALRDQLEKQLSALKRQGVIDTWHDRRIGAGENIHQAIDSHIHQDEIILLLVSSDFISSDYCYDIEMKRALERHAAGEAIVIPVILRPCDWHGTPFGDLNATPPDGKAITQWPNTDEAFLHVAKAVRQAAERWQQSRPSSSPAIAQSNNGGALSVTHVHAATSPVDTLVRSSNLRLTKQFTQRDKDQFLLASYEYIARFFENSLQELAQRNPGYEGNFRRLDANHFTAKLYRSGDAVARATVFMGGHFGSGIFYAHGENSDNGSYNESLTVNCDDQSVYLKSLGMASFRPESQLSQEGGAELFWSMFIEPVQQRFAR